LIILAVALLVFGPGKLPEIGGALGRGIRDFRKALEHKGSEPESDAKEAVDDQRKA
jgi:TatA/E family protein of Tat protein translocase